ncbi:MAG: PDZ domain-containing protein [Thermoanaerobaculia bacterium]
MGVRATKVGLWVVLATVAAAGVIAAAERDRGVPGDDDARVVVADGRAHRVRFITHEGGAFDLLGAGGGFLGVELVDLTPELRTHFGVPEEAGVMVGRVVDDSPAWRAGLRVGDIVTAIGGTAVGSSGDLAREVRGHGGETTVLDLWRDGGLEQVEVTLEERDATWTALASPFGDGDFHGLMERYGLSCEEERCGVTIRCDDGGRCECELNGETTECGGRDGIEEEE